MNYYATLGLDLQGDCEAGGGIWWDAGCLGASPGWCEKPGADYSATIEYYDTPAATQESQCTSGGGVWCDGKGSLRPECVAGGDTTSDCPTCTAAAEASGGCCEEELGACRADAQCEAALDCTLACGDLDCVDQCAIDYPADSVLEPLACLFGGFGLNRGACGDLCALPN
ncbi:MAG: hypothetical protein R3B89_06360 [Polyangiaceae bacterium]